MDGNDAKKQVGSPYRIRLCTADDIDVLVTTIRSAFGTVAERLGLNEQNCPTHASNCTAEWIRKDTARGIRYFALESEGRVAGSVALEQVRPGLCNLERLAVLPQQRRRGYGEALVEHVLSEAATLRCRDVRIGIIASEIELKEWYRKLGFVEVETRDIARLPFRVTFMIQTLGGPVAQGSQRNGGSGAASQDKHNLPEEDD
ncbi:MAG TPA: GNAT family N-acetyltransferase [Syntrophales bacterium]|nr:GNAT family N-acetyltransferase [Syntrophales bacterium]